LQRVAGELTPAVKTQLVSEDLARVRGVYADRLGKLRPAGPDPARNGP
jgi:hypothetical protein